MILFAEVEKTTRTQVRVDIDKLLATEWAADREQYDSDEEFAKQVLREIGTHDLLDPAPEDEFGIEVEGDYDEAEIRFMGTA